jgi:hypothetical protein
MGNSGKPAPEVGGEQALWQSGGVVDRFEARKRLELSMAMLAADGEMVGEARTGGRGGRRLGLGATRRCTGAWGRVGWGSEGSGRHCMVIPQQRHDSAVGAKGGGRRKSLSRGSGSLYSW